ncbi:hypothetical protein ACCS95_33475 [Rhizobium ruizarguesonis]
MVNKKAEVKRAEEKAKYEQLLIDRGANPRDLEFQKAAMYVMHLVHRVKGITGTERRICSDEPIDLYDLAARDIEDMLWYIYRLPAPTEVVA